MALPRWLRVTIVACSAAGMLAVFSLPAASQGVVSEWKSVPTPPVPELKTVTVNPRNTALMVMDFTDGICAAGGARPAPRCVAAIPKVKQLIEEARAHHLLVIYTGYPGYQSFVSALAPMRGEPLVVSHADKFQGTDLDKILKDHKITTLIETGMAANGCVFFTGLGAVHRGYKVIVPVDAMPGQTAYSEQSTIWGIENDGFFKNLATLTSVDRIKF
jgi:nicotinamidase-related amidase